MSCWRVMRCGPRSAISTTKRVASRMTIGGLYWHFVDVVWLFIFTTLYLSPFILRGR